MSKVHDMGDGRMAFHCPGCGNAHVVGVAAPAPVLWGWNGSLDAPTFTPSILTNHVAGSMGPRCHSFVTDGWIDFLADCEHGLKGTRVELPDFDAGWPNT